MTQDGHSALEYHSGETGEDERTTIIAGRNDFQLHSPDMMGEGNSDYAASLSLCHATLITDDAINGEGYEYTSDVNGVTYIIRATEDYAEKYGNAVGAYIDCVTGAAILVKSTSADISLSDVDIQSSTGVALTYVPVARRGVLLLSKGVPGVDAVHVPAARFTFALASLM